jgi:hypothetical protein
VRGAAVGAVAGRGFADLTIALLNPSLPSRGRDLE